jgi:hypothetical protein
MLPASAVRRAGLDAAFDALAGAQTTTIKARAASTGRRRRETATARGASRGGCTLLGIDAYTTECVIVAE